MTVADFLAADVQAVEVYGINTKGGMMARRWQMGTGTGMRQGPFDRGEIITGRRSRLDMGNWARVVVWLKRGRGS